MEEMITISGKVIGFRASARTPRMYRAMTGRDILRDILKVKEAFERGVKAAAEKPPAEDATEEEKRKYIEIIQDAQLSQEVLEIFEDLAYTMARQHAEHAGETIEATADEWLENFSSMAFYKVAPKLLAVWAANEKTTSEVKNG